MTTAYLNRIATAVPRHDVHAAFIDFAQTVLKPEHRAVFRRMVDRGAISHRYSPLEPAPPGGNSGPARSGFYRPGAFPTTAARMELYEREAPLLAERAVEGLGLGASITDITHLFVVTCTGFMAPGLDHAIVRRFGLPTSVERTVVGFMGCAASLNALKLARHVVRSEPDAKVLIVSVELCTLHLQEGSDLEQLLCFLIFGDGGAAALVSREPSGISLDRFATLVVPEAAALIRWSVGDQGFDMILSGRVPSAIGMALREKARDMWAEASPTDIGLWAVHPGGRSVLDAVENALMLPQQALSSSRAILRDYGNMSSATILFVLERIMANGSAEGSSGCALAFGPGLTMESMMFRKAA